MNGFRSANEGMRKFKGIGLFLTDKVYRKRILEIFQKVL